VLALASQYGKLQLSLRSRIDQETLSTEGQTPARLLVGAAPPRAAPAEEPKAQAPVRPRPAAAPVASVPAPAPQKPAAPVIEILRGTKVEERKLHTGNN
jgi:Flp pilus assembly protein CpaB